jgi:lipopolysaccharide biosynthesis glycosyltransferase
VNIYILTASVENRTAIPDDFAKRLQETMLEKKENIKIILIDITEKFGSYLPLANMGTRFTPLCMLRLFADTVEDIPDKILYLDTDVLCRGDLGSLYDRDVSDREIFGVPDRYGKWFFGNIFKHDYLNSGVLLMNMKRIRQSKLFEKCRNMCRDKRMFMPDQSAINKLAVKEKISVKYNEQGKIKPNTVVKHFTTFFKFFPYIRPVTVKPWQPDKLHSELGIYEFDDILEEYKRSNKNEERNPDIFYNR